MDMNIISTNELNNPSLAKVINSNKWFIILRDSETIFISKKMRIIRESTKT